METEQGNAGGASRTSSQNGHDESVVKKEAPKSAHSCSKTFVGGFFKQPGQVGFGIPRVDSENSLRRPGLSDSILITLHDAQTNLLTIVLSQAGHSSLAASLFDVSISQQC